MTQFVAQTIRSRLEDLARKDKTRRVFGADPHKYQLNPPLEASVLDAFDKRHGVSLPDDYRYFIAQIGNGGAGPYYGVLPFCHDESRGGLGPREVGSLVGDVGQPFKFNKACNINDWSPSIMNGAIPICHRGCYLHQWLVIHGEQRGFIWNDKRVDSGGLAPVTGNKRKPIMFADWYLQWLSKAERQCDIQLRA